MNTHQKMVYEFHKAFGIPAHLKPSLEGYRAGLRCRLIEEEAAEFRFATEAADLSEMLDALCDLLYVTYGAAVELGIDLEPFFAEVHRTNMAKVGGKTRADGKILKPDGWQPPRIREMLEGLGVG